MRKSNLCRYFCPSVLRETILHFNATRSRLIDFLVLSKLVNIGVAADNSTTRTKTAYQVCIYLFSIPTVHLHSKRYCSFS